MTSAYIARIAGFNSSGDQQAKHALTSAETRDLELAGLGYYREDQSLGRHVAREIQQC